MADAVKAVSQDMVRQAAEVIAMANESGKDVQSVINTMAGADISAKTLESTGNIPQSAPSPSTPSASDNGSSQDTSSDTGNASESSESLSIYPFAGNGFAWGGDLAAFVSDGSDTGERSDSPVNVHVHSWDEGEVTREATCNSDGIRTLTCRTCHKTKEVTIPAAHTFDDSKTLVESVRTTDGYVYDCQEINKVTKIWCEVCRSYVKVKEENKYPNHVFVEEGRTEDGTITYRCENTDDLIGNGSDPRCTAEKKILEQDS